MRVLVVKTSSLGDLIHTLPALTDAADVLPGIRFDWVAEQAFREIPRWHGAVDRVIPVAIRRWRKNPLGASNRHEMAEAMRALRAEQYQWIIDAQGLLKSALLARLGRGPNCGMDRSSCREPLAALAYQQRFKVPKGLHAIDRVRILFSRALGYRYRPERLDYGLRPGDFASPADRRDYLVFLHGTSWPSKLWPVENWSDLARKAQGAGFRILLPWGSEEEWQRARRMAKNCSGAEVLPPMGLTELAGILAHARGVVGVDTGLAHLAAALGVPGVTLYLATLPALTGARGPRQLCLGEKAAGGVPQTRGLEVANCAHLSAQVVWERLCGQMNATEL